MARVLYLILAVTFIAAVFSAPAEDISSTTTATIEDGHDVKAKSFGDWVKAPFKIAKGSVEFAKNVSKAAINTAEKITVGAVDMALEPVKYVGKKIHTKISEKWQEVNLKGLPADPKEYKYVVRILKGKDISNKLCGGVLIDNLWVLTAAHCFDNIKNANEIYVYVDTNRILTRETKQIIQVEEIFKRASYNQRILTFDLALVKLSQPAKFDAASIALPEKSDYDALSVNEGKGTALGTSKETNMLVKAQVDFLKMEKCAEFFDVYYNQLCVSNEQVEGVGSCTGESGFPVVQEENGKPVLVGIASYTGPDCSKVPYVYSNIAKHRSWIVKTIAA